MSEVIESNLPLVISANDFAQKLTDSELHHNVCIVDLSNESNYLAGHIPGAIHLTYQTLVLGQPPAPGKLPSLERLTEVFQYLGLTPETHFIVCDDEGGGWAGRFIWTLDIIGHKQYSYIDGGMIAWKAQKLALESGKSAHTPIQNNITISQIDRGPIVDMDEIMQGIENPVFMIWDARSPQEYDGTKVVAAKGGHIPGAINAEWTDLMDQQNDYKIRSDAKSYLQKRGIDGSLPIITHCQTHHRSGFTYLVGKVLSYDIRAYDGSWSEWGNHPDTPVEK